MSLITVLIFDLTAQLTLARRVQQEMAIFASNNNIHCFAILNDLGYGRQTDNSYTKL